MLNRRTLLALLLLLAGCPVWAADKPARPNILFIAIDDQNDWVGCLKGHPQAKTPNLDAVAARGTNFANAHCQAPLCNPSRTSLMFGLRPSTTGVHGLLPGPRAVAATKDRVSLPQALMAGGYWTYSCGKIYHDGAMRKAPKDKNAPEFDEVGPAPAMPKPKEKIVKAGAGNHPLMDWGVFPDDDKEQADWKIADAAIDALKRTPKEKPFFVACGFRLPHVPCFASQKWFDMYPEASLQMPPVLANDRADVPAFAWYLHWSLPEPRLSALVKAGEWKSLVRAYLACTTFMDSQIGRVVDTLKETGQLDNTIIVIWGDHGWHLGEKGITGKNTLWERSTRVPLVFAGPGITAGQTCKRPAELLDIYPTLVELTGVKKVDGLEGVSLVPQLKDASATRDRPAITTHNQGNHTVRSEHYRYIRYADGSEELYDMQNDPNEWKNLAKDPRLSTVVEDHRKWLPKVDVPAAPGSASRVLTKGENGEWIWEGKVINPKALEE
ncbi:sulfatase [Humisphaera borealis]|uniref:Sulfatase n=1 Tax=Humisphaera borealis TaxID=2807512 RepID=A0A7M2WZ58_9BACT|nr:sulfatase [Humisphaera borealis]QOV90788.1 sulfatase [Humisphaera borealis]